MGRLIILFVYLAAGVMYGFIVLGKGFGFACEGEICQVFFFISFCNSFVCFRFFLSSSYALSRFVFYLYLLLCFVSFLHFFLYPVGDFYLLFVYFPFSSSWEIVRIINVFF